MKKKKDFLSITDLSAKEIWETEDPKKAVKNADIVYTDTWISMGDEDRENRLHAQKALILFRG